MSGPSGAVTAPHKPSTALCYLLIACIGYCCYLHNRAEPDKLFWDENYHVTSAERYLEGIAQLEPHPPLGLMLIAAGEALSHTNRDIDKHILTTTKQLKGEQLPKGFDFSGMRLMPGIFALLGAMAFFGLLYELFQNRLHALLLSGLYLFENAFTVHFRAVHLDSFQMCFSILFLWRFVQLWRSTSPLRAWDYASLAVWAALAIMIKVNSVVLLALFPVLYLQDVTRHDRIRPPLWVADFAAKSGAAMVTLLIIFYAVFDLHARIATGLPDSTTNAGRQDLGNMSTTYREYLEQQETLTPRIVINIALDYFKFMDKDHHGVPKLDTSKPGENGSYPLHWPFHDRNINYRWDSANGKTAYVELIGNQLAWYSGTVAVFVALLLIVNYRVFGVAPTSSKQTYQWLEIFTGLYVAFMAMNLWLISQRVMYLYHYFFGLLLSYLILALMWQYASEVWPRFGKHRTAILASVMSAYFMSYLFFLPLSNHWPLTKAECERRNIWISQIVSCR